MTDDHTHRGDDVHSVEAAMREANGGWQPIETAPKDGTVFDVWCVSNKGYTDAPKRIENCRNIDGAVEYKHSHGWFTLNKYHFSHAELSHWMPLPAAPTEGK
jgi:hypothetical protein